MSNTEKIKEFLTVQPATLGGSVDRGFLNIADRAASPKDAEDDGIPSVRVGAAAAASTQPSAADDVTLEGPSRLLSLPFLGRRTLGTHQKVLITFLSIAVFVLGGLTFFAVTQSTTSSTQIAAVGSALVQSQRLAKSVSQAVVGDPKAFPDIRDSADILGQTLRGLSAGTAGFKFDSANTSLPQDLEKVLPLVARVEKSATLVLGQEKILTQVGNALRKINQQTSDLLEAAQAIAALKLAQNAPAAEISAAGQLVMLTQRIAKSANEFLMIDGMSAESVFLLSKDLQSFKEIAQGLRAGSAPLHLSSAKDAPVREQLDTLITIYDQTYEQANAILDNLQGLVSAREAHVLIASDSELLRRQLETLQAKLSAQSRLDPAVLGALIVAGLFSLLCATFLARVQVQDSRQRQQIAEQEKIEAKRREQDAKRVNDANQAAILRLMNELQRVAEGDLTQQATVSEDTTGAIADSVNYTVQELRQLVAHVQNTTTQVVQTTAQVENTSTQLLAASTEQLREIRSIGQSVLDMAARINQVSSQAQSSSQVARQSLTASQTGLQAVQDTIGGMNSIRDQIQETSKRIKRLGESSQEIGEITELISDITEQTNVLALNAAIQAASAGEAGRGFSIVAEEVQRLAERSADATRQIATLVKTIQADTQDAVAAMERSTQGVVQGAQLSDSAGTALSEIDAVTRRLADLIEQISDTTSKEAASANVVAQNIQKIFVVTEQTGQGTRSTVQQVRDLSREAQALRQSVARFKIA